MKALTAKRQRVFKPNDAREGDVLVWCRGNTIILVVEVSASERRVDTVMLFPGEQWMSQPGARVSTTYSCKSWKRYLPELRYLCRGWEAVLRPENVTDADGVTMEK